MSKTIIHNLNIITKTDFVMRFLELKEKEVINCKDCKRLGYVADIEFDCKTGRITAIIVPGPGKILSCFGSNSEYYIRFNDIVRIGPDIVLVDIDHCNIHKMHDNHC